MWQIHKNMETKKNYIDLVTFTYGECKEHKKIHLVMI